MNQIDLKRELDKTKATVFMGSNAAFFGSLLCSLEFRWDESISTAQTDGREIVWNPDFFTPLYPDERKFILLHEIHHVARLHMIRMGNRDPKIWNQACDLRINFDLVQEGYSYGRLKPWYDPNVGKLAEEDIYDLLISGQIPPPPSSWMGVEGDDGGDMQPNGDIPNAEIIGRVVQATQQAKLAGQKAGNISGQIEELLEKFLAPIVPWQTLLNNFFTDLVEESMSWNRPNRRYQDIYLPSKYTDEGRLEHLIYYLDVSGSISNDDVIRFNSEVKYIKETYNPKKLTLVQFDTQITKEQDFYEEDPFEKIEIVGRGGTSLVPVWHHIHEHNPTAAIIFSDLECSPMSQLKRDIPVIWIVVNNPSANVSFGKKVCIRV